MIQDINKLKIIRDKYIDTLKETHTDLGDLIEHFKTLDTKPKKGTDQFQSLSYALLEANIYINSINTAYRVFKKFDEMYKANKQTEFNMADEFLKEFQILKDMENKA